MYLIVIAGDEFYSALLGISLDRATLMKFESNQADTISKAANPGKFEDKRTWPEWELTFEYYLSTIPGFNCVPLPYVMRYQSSPDRTTDFQGDFIAETIAFAPLSVAHFQADTRKVHRLLKNYLVADTAE